MYSTNWRDMPCPNKFYVVLTPDDIHTFDTKHRILEQIDEQDIHVFPQDYARDTYCVRNDALVANPNSAYDEVIMDKQIAMWRAWDALGDAQYMQEQYRGKSDINPDTGNTYYADYTAQVATLTTAATTAETDFQNYMNSLRCYTISYEPVANTADLPTVYNDDDYSAPVPQNQWKYPHITSRVRMMLQDADNSALTWKVFALADKEVAANDYQYLTSDFDWYMQDREYEGQVYLGWKIAAPHITFDVSNIANTSDLRVVLNCYETVSDFTQAVDGYTVSVGQLGIYVYSTGSNAAKYQISSITDATTGNSCTKKLEGSGSPTCYGSQYSNLKITSANPVIKIEQLTSTGAGRRPYMPKISWTFDSDVTDKSLDMEGIKSGITADGSISYIASGSAVRVHCNNSAVFYDSSFPEMDGKYDYLIPNLNRNLTFKIKNKPSS